MADSKAGQEIYKMSLQCLVVPENKGSASKNKMMGYVKGTQEPTERAHNSQSWNNLRKTNKNKNKNT